MKHIFCFHFVVISISKLASFKTYKHAHLDVSETLTDMIREHDPDTAGSSERDSIANVRTISESLNLHIHLLEQT